jgi:invasion protein IalB
MDHPCALMPTMRRALVVATAMLVWAQVPTAMAQQFTPSPARIPPKKPSASPATPPAAGQPQGREVGSPQFIFSPWTKICGKDGPDGANAREVCAVLTEARVQSGQIAVAASLVEPRDGSQKILRVTLPLGVRLPYGTRVMVDQGAALQSNYLMCLTGCISDYEAKPDLVEKLKKGQTLTIQAINPGGYQISIDVPLMDFAKVDEGPPTDEKVVIEREKKLEEELQRRAGEARNKIEGQPPQAAQSNDPFTAPAAK